MQTIPGCRKGLLLELIKKIIIFPKYTVYEFGPGRFNHIVP